MAKTNVETAVEMEMVPLKRNQDHVASELWFIHIYKKI